MYDAAAINILRIIHVIWVGDERARPDLGPSLTERNRKGEENSPVSPRGVTLLRSPFIP
jgi:hypothetical protein